MFAGGTAQQAGPAGNGARTEALDRAQALASGGRCQAAQLATTNKQHAHGQHIGHQHRLTQAEAAGFQQGIQQDTEFGRQLIEGVKAAQQLLGSGGGH